MPNKPGRGAFQHLSAKEKRRYEHIKKSAQKSGRYGARTKEVAARTVIKKYSSEGHGKHKS